LTNCQARKQTAISTSGRQTASSVGRHTQKDKQMSDRQADSVVTAKQSDIVRTYGDRQAVNSERGRGRVWKKHRTL